LHGRGILTLGNNGRIYRSLQWQQERPRQELMRVRFECCGLSVLLETNSSFLFPDANESAPTQSSHGTLNAEPSLARSLLTPTFPPFVRRGNGSCVRRSALLGYQRARARSGFGITTSGLARAHMVSALVSRASPANSRLAIERSAAARCPKPQASGTTSGM
jgi:hypothetical protein